MIIRLASSIQTDSIVDGIGLRTVIWTQGCKHNCFGCQNPETHSFSDGFETTTEHIVNLIKDLKLQRGITFSGGEPFEQAQQCAEIAESAHNIGLDVWVYTGYIFEQILETDRDDWNRFLNSIDILVDGPFVFEKKNINLRFRGSENQRIIDINKSFQNKTICLFNFF